MDARSAKAELRKLGKARRRALSEEERMRGSVRAVRRVEALPVYRRSTIVALFASFGDEIDCSHFENDFDRRVLLYPKVDRGHLEFLAARRSELRPGTLGILEPTAAHRPQELFRADVVVVPGLLFTRSGARLGYGKGYYDRALRRARVLGHPTPPVAIALAFEAQLVDDLPMTDADELVDAISTERELIVCTSFGRSQLA